MSNTIDGFDFDDKKTKIYKVDEIHKHKDFLQADCTHSFNVNFFKINWSELLNGAEYQIKYFMFAENTKDIINIKYAYVHNEFVITVTLPEIDLNCNHQKGECGSYVNEDLISILYVAIYLDDTNKPSKTDSVKECTGGIVQYKKKISWKQYDKFGIFIDQDVMSIN